MRQEGLLVGKGGSRGSGRAHDGTIITDTPNEMWATDGKEFKTQAEGKCWFIGVIDHFNDEIMSFHLCKRFDRYAALEPFREAVTKVFGSNEKNVCEGLGIALRSDHGSQFESKTFKDELAYLGVKYSPAFVRSPECNGIIERFHRILNEQVFYLEEFESLEEANGAMKDFIEKYNNKWLLHRLGLKSPVAYRAEYCNQ